MKHFSSIKKYLILFMVHVYLINVIDGFKPNQTESNNKLSNKLSLKEQSFKDEIEKAGCEYQDKAQLLQKHVCTAPGYDKAIAPNNTEGKTIVDVKFETIEVTNVDDKDGRFKLLLKQYMEWVDEEINISNVYVELSHDAISKIWTPQSDIITENLRAWESLNNPHVYTLVSILHNYAWYRDRSEAYGNASFASITAQKNWNADISCKFKLGSYPMDTQTCRFEQDAYYSSQFLDEGDNLGEWTYNANGFYVTIKYTGSFIEYNNSYPNMTVKDFGFDITLERMFQPFLFQYYLPCMAIVLVSQISFIIPLSSLPGRVALVVTQFLTLTNIFIYSTVSCASILIQYNCKIRKTIMFNFKLSL